MIIIPASVVLSFASVLAAVACASGIRWIPEPLQTLGWAKLVLMPHAVLVPSIAIAAVLAARGRRRLIARLVEARGQLCLNCAYPLGDSLGFCPECGAASDGLSLRRGWCRTYPALAYDIDWPTASTAVSASPSDRRPVSL